MNSKFIILWCLIACIFAQSGSRQGQASYWCPACPAEAVTASCLAFRTSFQLYYEAGMNDRHISPVTNNRTEFLDGANAFFKEHYGLDYSGEGPPGSSIIWFQMNPENHYVVYSAHGEGIPQHVIPSGNVKIFQEQIIALVLDPAGVPLGGHHNGTVLQLNQMLVYGEAYFYNETYTKKIYPSFIFKSTHWVDVMQHGSQIQMDVEHPILGNGLAIGSVVFDQKGASDNKYTVGNVMVNFPATLSESASQTCQVLQL